MIDVAKEVSAFKPIDLTRIPDKYRPATEQMRTAFVLYNKALHEVQIGHDDAAKNYVKKAVALFPDFYEAIMVHGILVFANGDRIGAVRVFSSVKDLDQRAVSIETFDRLVKEAERPETSRTGYARGASHERGKADSVISRTSVPSVRSDAQEAKYSRGRVFERSSGYYEEQSSRSGGAYSGRYSSSYTSRSEVRNERSARAGRNVYDRNREDDARVNAGDANEFRVLNKYLLIIVAILLIFSIVVSTILINKMKTERSLREQLEALSSYDVSSPSPHNPDPDISNTTDGQADTTPESSTDET